MQTKKEKYFPGPFFNPKGKKFEPILPIIQEEVEPEPEEEVLPNVPLGAPISPCR
ncbi:hypothetical protein [Legionella fallonii]|uniref:Uncharacterized protein n=1 Tax=Legionella fallonii LLAP-10 TaxID=1212491 RepID=A0A098G6K0_9GAMM|nr:hypothetical protein [Legionella fallonii]CEG57140.1 protein of unknown function [Legionella fallonii LLAP-10]